MNNKNNSKVSKFLSKKVSESEFDNSELIVTHNMVAEDLLTSFDEYNGLLAPSIAISGLNAGLCQYGDITLVLDKSVLSKNGDSKIENVYDVDFYSETFPEVEYDFDTNASENIFQSVNENNSVEIINSLDWKNVLCKGYDKLERYLENSDLMKFHFLKNHMEYNNYDVPMKYQQPRLDDLFESKKFITFITKNEITENPTQEIVNKLKELIFSEIENSKKIYIEDFSPEDSSKYISRLERKKNRIFNRDTPDEIAPYYLDMFVKASKILNERKKIVNKDKLEKDIKKIFKQNNIEDEYKNFVINITNEIFTNKHFKMGNSKKLFTEENILEYFSKNKGVAYQDTLVFTLGKARSLSAKKMTTFRSVFENRDNLVSSSHLESIVTTNDNLFKELTDKIYDCAENDDVWHINNSVSELLSLNESKLSDDEIYNKFKNKKLGCVDDDIISGFRELNNKLHKSKVDYFEAKPVKKVTKEDIVGIIVPRSLSKENKHKIKSLGIKVTYYDGSEIESRNKAVSSYKKHSINESNVYTKKRKRSMNI